MPPRVPGGCIEPGCHLQVEGDALRCWWHEALYQQGQARDGAQRPAQLCPPRSEPIWGRTRIVTVECHPSQDAWMSAAGYRLTAQIKDPHTGLITSHVWAKEVTDEGC